MIPVGIANLPRWQALIELDSSMSADERTQFTNALDAISQTKAGQQLLKDLHHTQSWVQAIGLNNIKIWELAIKEDLLLIDKVTERRQYPDKVFIAAVHPEQKEFYGFVEGHRYAVATYKQVVAISLPDLHKIKNFTVDSAGNKTVSIHSLDVTLIHELQHMVDLFKPTIPRTLYTHACAEERALTTENRYITEISPNAPQRKEYLDVLSAFQRALVKHPEFNRQFHTSMDENTMGMLAHRTLVSIYDNVELNHGCTPVPKSELWQEARAVLMNAGISAENMQRLEQAVPELKTPPS